MYRKVLLSSFHNGKVEYCTTSGTGDIEENARPFFLLRLYLYLLTYIYLSLSSNCLYIIYLVLPFLSEFYFLAFVVALAFLNRFSRAI